MTKALTVRHPWAWAIINGGKDVENRARRSHYLGRLYIHAGKAMDFDAFTFPALQAAEKEYLSRGLNSIFDKINEIDLSTTGMVIGTVDVVECHHADYCWDDGQHCSPWAQPDAWHWVLANPLPIEVPFEAKGQLGIWNLAPSSAEQVGSLA